VLLKNSAAFAVVAAFSLGAGAQQTSQVQLNIGASNRTLTVSTEERVTVEPELAILHIGFETQPSDAKTAYANGAKTSKQISASLQQAGIAQTSIRSDDQYISSVDFKAKKFKFTQSWTVDVTPARAAEILDIAVDAGATQSGQIEWTVNDVKALEARAIAEAAARARSDADELARGMGVHLGALVYVSHEVTETTLQAFAIGGFEPDVAADKKARAGPEVSISPRKVSRTAKVYAVFAIE
jgi:hypothetical protein